MPFQAEDPGGRGWAPLGCGEMEDLLVDASGPKPGAWMSGWWSTQRWVRQERWTAAADPGNVGLSCLFSSKASASLRPWLRSVTCFEALASHLIEKLARPGGRAGRHREFYTAGRLGLSRYVEANVTLKC